MNRGQVLDHIINYVKYRQLVGLLVFFLYFTPSYSQVKDLCVPVKNKKAVYYYEEAIKVIDYNYKQAYFLLHEALKIEPYYVQVHFVLGEVNYQKAINALTDIHEIQMLERYYSRAEKSFLRVIDYCPSHNDYIAHYFLGEFYYDSKQYKKSAFHLNEFVINSKKDSYEKKKAKSMFDSVNAFLNLVENPVLFNPVILKGVSTKADEFLPYFSPDAQHVFYTRRYKHNSKNSYTTSYFEEFTYSDLISLSDTFAEIYTQGQKMPFPFNDGRNQGAVSLTIDNNQLYITICEFTRINNEPYKNCDIYVANKINGNWTELINLGDSINGKNTWEGQPSISADGKTLYFASARENGFGGIDLYRSTINNEGKWTKAENLGSTLNTAKDDKSPFLHTDNHTLYFSSNGRLGMGGFDIYLSRLNNEGIWSEPLNIGYPINTMEDDLGFIVNTNGEKAYFSSNKLKGAGGWDIYSFELYKEAQPKKVLFVKGHLFDEKGELIVDADVELKSIQTSKITEGIVDKMTGKYAVAVSVLKNEEFIMTVKKKDYAFTSEYIDPHEEEYEDPADVDFEVKKIEEGVKVELNNIYFAFNSDTIDNRSKIVLDNFREYLFENESLKIRIDGHTDDIDTKEFNMDLSIRRAKAVQDYLISSGIQRNRISFKGFGETVPVSDNISNEGRALNRRTEFVIIEK
jgi:outer membrane protein OmpA-like peptidoglycan-associated protein/tetratricopeptide (TPR) repeat protein